jgi:hypothetical protein
MLTDVIALDLIVRDRIHSRIAEAANDRLADQLPSSRAGALAAPLGAFFAAASNGAAHAFGATFTAARLTAAHALRGLAAEIDPCARGDTGFLIARPR